MSIRRSKSFEKRRFSPSARKTPIENESYSSNITRLICRSSSPVMCPVETALQNSSGSTNQKFAFCATPWCQKRLFEIHVEVISSGLQRPDSAAHQRQYSWCCWRRFELGRTHKTLFLVSFSRIQMQAIIWLMRVLPVPGGRLISTFLPCSIVRSPSMQACSWYPRRVRPACASARRMYSGSPRRRLGGAKTRVDFATRVDSGFTGYRRMLDGYCAPSGNR